MDSQFNNQQNSFQQDNGYTYYSTPDMTVENIPDPANRRYGLGRAIAAQILASVAVFMGVIALYAVLFAVVEWDFDSVSSSLLLFGGFLSAGCIAMSVIAIVLGVRSIKCFKQKLPRPVATLVLGISAVVESSAGIVVGIYDIIFLVAAYALAFV